MYSYHNFLFPFRFDKIIERFDNRHTFYSKVLFDERVQIDKNFKSSLEKSGWEYQKFEVKNHLDYNELVYFYDFVKDSLFNTQEFDTNATSYYFQKRIKDDAKYIIKIKDKEPYELDLSGVTLRIFDTGVGILSFEIENHRYSSLEDIFNINEYGRRIYPQFLKEEFSVDEAKDKCLADFIEVNGIKEEFKKEYRDIELANFILEILGDTFTTRKDDVEKNYIQPIIDDRMFVVSHILSNEFSDLVKNCEELPDRWYEYLFVDKYNDKTIQNREMQKSLIEKTTYKRWQGYGTLYGMSRYSFVVLSDNRYEFSKKTLLNHVKTLYFQMVILLLATRASILRFSDEITAISDIDADKDTVKKISNLYKNYLRFKNKLYFKEVTPQEQGIELYDQLRDVMRIDNDINDLSNEISSLYSYAFMLQEKEEKEQMNTLTKLGTIFLPPSLIAGIFGMNIFPENSVDNCIGWIISFGLMFGTTWWLSKIHNIEVYKFLGIDRIIEKIKGKK
jgi:Mg2+ and Co2+ transporter CorA